MWIVVTVVKKHENRCHACNKATYMVRVLNFRNMQQLKNLFPSIKCNAHASSVTCNSWSPTEKNTKCLKLVHQTLYLLDALHLLVFVKDILSLIYWDQIYWEMVSVCVYILLQWIPVQDHSSFTTVQRVTPITLGDHMNCVLYEW